MNIKKFGKTVPREAFKRLKVLDKTYWAYSQVLDINKIGKVAEVLKCAGYVVVCPG